MRRVIFMRMAPYHKSAIPAGAGVIHTLRDADLDARHGRLEAILEGTGPSLVAFSGGVDSTLLLHVAHDVLGDRVLAVTAVSPSLSSAERDAAVSLAHDIGAAHRLIETREMEDPGYVANDGQRCYHCKRELFRALSAFLRDAAGRVILYGAIPDDLGDDRPGMRAAAEAGVRAPLVEAGLSKSMIRDLSRRLGLPTWDKPAMACLASRIPLGTRVTAEALVKVERAEAAIRALGYRQVRVRHHGDRARVELDVADLPRALVPAERDGIVAAVRAAGYDSVD